MVDINKYILLLSAYEHYSSRNLSTEVRLSSAGLLACLVGIWLAQHAIILRGWWLDG
jgi:hypothetical protein